tara:strand:+ start:331 stop:852 length:522 start_codon:yes stop_codon:yes gene_type:complete
MFKIIKISLILFFLLISTNISKSIEPPFKNIILSEKPKEYKDILFKNFEGNVINLNDEKSNFFMLNFWATWCLPCKEEMPHLDKLQNTNGIKIYPINIEKNNKLKTEIFFKSLEIKNLSIFFDVENNLVNLFRLRGIPTTIILNKDKKEIARIIGVADLSNKKFVSWLNSFTN